MAPFWRTILFELKLLQPDSILFWIALLCIGFTKYPTPIFSVHSLMLLLSFKHLICIVLCLSAFGWLCVCVCVFARRRQTSTVIVMATCCRHRCSCCLHCCCSGQTNIEYSTSFMPHSPLPPASPWFPCFSSLPPFAYHPFISISALLRGANCTKFAQVPPKCTMKMNNYVYEFSSLLLLIIPSCRLVCLIKCLRGSDKNIFLITEYTNLQLWATK